MQIEEYLSQNEIEATPIHFENPVKTTADCEANGIPASQVVKSILLILDEQTPTLCVPLGSDKIDYKKIRTLKGINNVRTATPEEILQRTGFEVGGVIPTIPNLETIIDSNILNLEEVYSGGGDSSTLLKLGVSEILKFGATENIHRDPEEKINKI